MRLQPDETTLVITGAWNPAILNPQWVVANGFGRDPSNEQFQVAMPMGPNAVFQDLRYTVADCNYIARPDALIFQSLSDRVDVFAPIEDAAAKILSELLHTPITGIGHNFAFKDEHPLPAWLEGFSFSQRDLVDVAPDDWESVHQTISSSFKAGNAIVNIQRIFNGVELFVKFNFHHTVTGAKEGINVLRGDGFQRLVDNFNNASAIVEALYGGNND